MPKNVDCQPMSTTTENWEKELDALPIENMMVWDTLNPVQKDMVWGLVPKIKEFIRSLLAAKDAELKEKLEGMMGEHTDACADSPLKECNHDCPQKALSDGLALLEDEQK